MGEPINANGAEIWTERRGHGRDVLLIAGLGDPAEVWQPQLDGLSDRYRLTAFDNRGVGRTPLPEERLSATMMADDDAALLHALEIPSAHVAGYSMGSAIAQELAIRHPEIVRSLVFVSSYAPSGAPSSTCGAGWQRSCPASAPSWRASSRGSTLRALTRTARWLK
jgi:pimeloyl-ACP methyl ester carboxylesterase